MVAGIQVAASVLQSGGACIPGGGLADLRVAEAIEYVMLARRSMALALSLTLIGNTRDYIAEHNARLEPELLDQQAQQQQQSSEQYGESIEHEQQQLRSWRSEREVLLAFARAMLIVPRTLIQASDRATATTTATTRHHIDTTILEPWRRRLRHERTSWLGWDSLRAELHDVMACGLVDSLHVHAKALANALDAIRIQLNIGDVILPVHLERRDYAQALEQLHATQASIAAQSDEQYYSLEEQQRRALIERRLRSTQPSS